VTPDAPLRDRARQRRIQILQSPAAAFRRRGYHGARVEEIPRELHMTKGSLYHYFQSKEEILHFCHDYSLDILLDLLSEVESEGPPLRKLITSFVHMIIDELRGVALTLDFGAHSPLLSNLTDNKTQHTISPGG